MLVSTRILGDPERAFAAALSSCHMLFFIAICSKKRLVVQNYVDQASAFLEKDEQGDLVISRVILRSKVTFAQGAAVLGATAQGAEVDRKTIEKIHHRSHERCFLVKSVKSEVIVQPVWDIS